MRCSRRRRQWRAGNNGEDHDDVEIKWVEKKNTTRIRMYTIQPDDNNERGVLLLWMHRTYTNRTTHTQCVHILYMLAVCAVLFFAQLAIDHWYRSTDLNWFFVWIFAQHCPHGTLWCGACIRYFLLYVHDTNCTIARSSRVHGARAHRPFLAAIECKRIKPKVDGCCCVHAIRNASANLSPTNYSMDEICLDLICLSSVHPQEPSGRAHFGYCLCRK